MFILNVRWTHCLQGPEFDEEEESEFTVTELKERACKQRAELERRMMGGGSDDEDDEEKNGESKKSQSKQSSEDTGCSWGMGKLSVGVPLQLYSLYQVPP